MYAVNVEFTDKTRSVVAVFDKLEDAFTTLHDLYICDGIALVWITDIPANKSPLVQLENGITYYSKSQIVILDQN